MILEDKLKNIRIEARDIQIGHQVVLGENIHVKVRGTFAVGPYSRIGNGFRAVGENIRIGEHYYYGPTRGGFLDIGGGGSNFPFADLTIGDGCVMHTGGINIARPVTIGNEVGLSHDVDIITHGFWHSVLDGGPATFEKVHIGNNVIIGWKTVIMPGVEIADDVVVGANATITKSLLKKGIYAGTPAKFIKELTAPSLEQSEIILQNIVDDFRILMQYYEVPKYSISARYPFININNLCIDTIKKSCSGEHDDITDAFRDFLRRFGIRIHVPGGFKFNLKRI